MPVTLTRRQEEIWRKKMVVLEKSILSYFSKADKRLEVPDGSFAMSAFKEGYWLRARKEKARR